MRQEIIQIIMATIGTLGFSIYFRVSEKNVFFSVLGGALGWTIYLIVYHFSNGLFWANFVAAFILILYSKLMARLIRTPSDVFLVPSIIPLLPGGTLYYTMAGLVETDQNLFITNLEKTGIITFGIVAGILLGTVIITYIKKLVDKKKEN